MKQSTIELWVGVFVAIGIAALVFLSLQVAGGTEGLLVYRQPSAANDATPW